MPKYRCATKNFSSQRDGVREARFVELGHSNEDFVKKIRKRGPAGKHFGVFSPTLKTTF